MSGSQNNQASSNEVSAFENYLKGVKWSNWFSGFKPRTVSSVLRVFKYNPLQTVQGGPNAIAQHKIAYMKKQFKQAAEETSWWNRLMGRQPVTTILYRLLSLPQVKAEHIPRIKQIEGVLRNDSTTHKPFIQLLDNIEKGNNSEVTGLNPLIAACMTPIISSVSARSASDSAVADASGAVAAADVAAEEDADAAPAVANASGADGASSAVTMPAPAPDAMEVSHDQAPSGSARADAAGAAPHVAGVGGAPFASSSGASSSSAGSLGSAGASSSAVGSAGDDAGSALVFTREAVTPPKAPVTGGLKEALMAAAAEQANRTAETEGMAKADAESRKVEVAAKAVVKAAEDARRAAESKAAAARRKGSKAAGAGKFGLPTAASVLGAARGAPQSVKKPEEGLGGITEESDSEPEA